MPVALMTPVITAAMSKLIKVVGSLSYFHAESVRRRSFKATRLGANFARGRRGRNKEKKKNEKGREKFSAPTSATRFLDFEL